jgi:DNA modification methylase
VSVRILIGDCREKLRDLPDASVNCCVTSPPYFGLRDYGVDGQMGLEPTPDEFVNGMVEVFREVRRVLRDDGTLWVNIGDSYATDPKGPNGAATSNLAGGGDYQAAVCKAAKWNYRQLGFKRKDLIGIPWMLAFALRADGWFLRQDIIWSKPNPMPESVRDRCTKAHEYLFLLSKSQRYYFDANAIKEDCVRGDAGSEYHSGQTAIHQLGRASEKPRKQRKPAGWDTGAGGHGSFHREGRAEIVEYTDATEGRRNKRSVWGVATQPFSEAHFATYPPALIEPCILAGCPKGGAVLDPFGGAGTTGLVADRLQRNAILIELNPQYAEIARNRIASEAGMFGEVLAA